MLPFLALEGVMSERWRGVRIASTWLRMQGQERESMQRLEAPAGEGSKPSRSSCVPAT